ncbi:MAG: TIR domain-containing protein [Ktedonobacteraceae bacterium]|nr:TIR domain-containing protein [Ktedonobacteraceae bacterium]
MDKHVFISYKHEDSDFAENLIHRVENAGFKTWVDSDKLAAGEDWRTGIDESIRNAFALIVIMTPEAKASEYVTYEWAFAWGAGVKVIPILHKSTQLHPRLEALQHLDFTSRTNRPWDKLFNVLSNAAAIASSNVPLTSQDHASFPQNNHQPTKESWLEKGAIFLKRKDYELALEAFRQAILLDHNDALAYSGRSEALDWLERYNAMARCYACDSFSAVLYQSSTRTEDKRDTGTKVPAGVGTRFPLATASHAHPRIASIPLAHLPCSPRNSLNSVLYTAFIHLTHLARTSRP